MLSEEHSRALPMHDVPARFLGAVPEAPSFFAGLLLIMDAAVAVAASVLAYGIRHSDAAMPVDYWLATLLAAFLVCQFLNYSNGYDFSALCRRSAQFGRCLSACFLAAVALATLSFLFKSADEFSRVWAIAWFASAAVGCSLNRVALSAIVCRLNQDGRFCRRTVVVGLGDLAADVSARLRRAEGVRVVGVFSGVSEICVADVLAFLRRIGADEVIVAVPFERGREISKVLQRLAEISVDVKLCPGVPELPSIAFPHARGLDVPTWPVFVRPLRGWKRFLKRLEDVVLSAALLLFFAPLMALVALLVRLDSPGPVLFRQQRHGFNSAPFTVLKFRTMRHGLAEDAAVPQALPGDPRVTRLGRFLRASSADELPQLFNVLRGDMSLIGPRPHAVAHGEHYSGLVDLYFARHRVKPGITGWAQVNGLRGETRDLEKMRLRVEHDLYYVENWSIFFDLKILALTVWAVLRGTNAH